MNKYILVLLFLISGIVKAQLPDTDIFLADIKNDHGKLSFGTPVNITNRKGYDNQPHFTPDGKNILYVSIRDTIGSDIFRYSIATKKIDQVTHTPESEYSPTYSLNGKDISVVRVDTDGAQRFYNLQINKIENAKDVKGTDSIGYYCQLNDSMLAMFILGNAMTLQVLNMNTHQRKLVSSDIGRCMKLSIDKKNLLFVIKQNDADWSIFEMNITSSSIKKIASTIKGNEDFVVMPDGTLLMGNDGKLFQYKPETDSDWKEIADFTSTIKSFYRIAVSAKGDRIAFVAYSGKKP